MTDPPTKTVPPVDLLAVEQCMDGYIPLRKLTAPEKVAVVTRLQARGYTPTETAVRAHGTVAAVNAALTRHRDAARKGA